MSRLDSGQRTPGDNEGESNCSHCRGPLTFTTVPDNLPPGYTSLSDLHTKYPVAKEIITDTNGNDIVLYLYHLKQSEPYTEALEHTISNIYEGNYANISDLKNKK